MLFLTQMQPTVYVGGFRFECDSVYSSIIGAPEKPPQPNLFIVRKSLPYGLNDKPGFILLAEKNELLKSTASYRTILKPVAWAYEGDSGWTQKNSGDWGWLVLLSH